MDRRTLLRDSGAVAFGALALSVVGATPPAGAHHPDGHTPMPDPATTPVPNPPFPRGLTAAERAHLKTFDELDFDVFTHQDWDRLGESHAPNIRVHWPDGHYADGIERHIADLKAQFVWAPDTRILEHNLRIAMNEFTLVTGVMRGTFTRPMPDGKGGFIPPTGKKYAINMATVGIWNRRRGYMDEEFLFWDDRNFFAQLGIGS
ncbi:ester cyclase [Kribbella sp. CA-253562]|uniref:ester cyclase n=1 Tax=Kribbella sp. CA-253562 TaxID=3239942 RepID=UPI003D8EA9BE